MQVRVRTTRHSDLMLPDHLKILYYSYLCAKMRLYENPVDPSETGRQFL